MHLFIFWVNVGEILFLRKNDINFGNELKLTRRFPVARELSTQLNTSIRNSRTARAHVAGRAQADGAAAWKRWTIDQQVRLWDVCSGRRVLSCESCSNSKSCPSRLGERWAGFTRRARLLKFDEDRYRRLPAADERRYKSWNQRMNGSQCPFIVLLWNVELALTAIRLSEFDTKYFVTRTIVGGVLTANARSSVLRVSAAAAKPSLLLLLTIL